MVKIISFFCFLAFFFVIGVHASPLDSAKQEGRKIGELGKKQGINQVRQFNSNEFVNSVDPNIDPNLLKEQVQHEQEPSNEIVNYLKNGSVQQNKENLSEEYFLNRSEKITQQGESDHLEIQESDQFTIETCRQTDAPFPLSVVRELQVDVDYKPEMTKEEKACLGHDKEERFSKWKSAQETAEKWKQEFDSDASIKNFNVHVQYNGVFHKHLVEANWTHHVDSDHCNNHQVKKEVIREASWEEVGEKWVYEDEQALNQTKTPYCTYVEKTCLDATPSKIINGKEVKRQCWKEKMTFLCRLPNPNDCPHIRNQNCELLKKECLKRGEHGCTLWELTFKCYSNFRKKDLGKIDPYGMDEDPDYIPNDSFSEIATKFAVFDAIKKDLEEIDANNSTAVQVFKGKKMECSKSVADKVMYDCCFNYSGLAKELGLKKCTADEIALAEMREKGYCHYIGSYEGKFIDLWKSRDEHVFCCFGSKLARILHENARPQLEMGWGKAKHADCRGLSLEEISHLDFSKMDFSELYSDIDGSIPSKFQEKCDSFQRKMQKKMEASHV